jgi:hypothetical protein
MSILDISQKKARLPESAIDQRKTGAKNKKPLVVSGKMAGVEASLYPPEG